MSVIGFDDLPFSGYLSPSLTTIAVDPVLQGSLAAELLIKRLKGETIAEPRIEMPTRLIERDSSAPARAARRS